MGSFLLSGFETALHYDRAYKVPCTNERLSVDLTKKSTHFGEFAEIRLINARLDNKHGTGIKYKTCFLENGSKLTQPVNLKNTIFFFQSCPLSTLCRKYYNLQQSITHCMMQ